MVSPDSSEGHIQYFHHSLVLIFDPPPPPPDPQNVRKMHFRKSPMDMNKNRNVKLMQVSSQVAEKASSDGTTNKQCRPAHRQSTRTTVTETYTNFSDKPKPTLSQTLGWNRRY